MDSVTLHLSCAVSADGYLDDNSPDRAILSSPEDLEAVLALRARMDMIVIGAETLRRDNPSLATRGIMHAATRKDSGRAPDPVKLVVTRSGDIPSERAFFETGQAEAIVLSVAPCDVPGTNERLIGEPIDEIIDIAKARGLNDVLIEGGAQLLTIALPRARYLRLAVSPKQFGESGHARLFDDLRTFLAPLHVTHTERLGNTTIHHVDLLLSRAHPLMERAFTLSEQCPPSPTAFSVGAMGCDERLGIVATGYSRETGPKDHAEEAMLGKASAPIHTAIVTLEPCLHRASKPTGCAQSLVAAGIRRVIYAVAEDETFTRQSGLSYLREHGVDILHMPGFEARFRAVNAPIYGTE